MSDETTATPEQKTDNPFDPTQSIETARSTFDKLLAAANVEAVYAKPVQNGDTIVISSAEVVSMAGFGYGVGGGKDERTNLGGGGGGGGWGNTVARPVAAIIIEPSGVHVEPIVDPTKIAIALFTTLGFMIATVARMSRRRTPKF